MTEFKEIIEKAYKDNIEKPELLNTELEEINRKNKINREEIQIKSEEEYFKMRKSWNMALLIALGTILIFNILLILGVGKGYLNFSDEWFLRLVLTTNLADVIGLIYVVVKFLFINPPQYEKKLTASPEKF